MSMPLDQGQRRAEGSHEALKIGFGLGAGLIPAACAIIFFATLCPYGNGTTCHEPTNGFDVDLFVGTVSTYLVQVIATIVCFIWRTRGQSPWV